MEELQVLVAAMHQQDLSLWEKMQIRCDAIVANQADREEIQTASFPEGTVKMITTPTRGVGKNRNIALEAATAPLLLFADQDMTYYSAMAQGVCKAFADEPSADVLIFGIDITRNGKITENRHLKRRRLHIWNVLRFGTCLVGIRRAAVEKHGLRFHESFGGGCPFSAGEDSLFLKACLDKGLKIYTSEYVLGQCSKDTSTWFRGYGNKYFYDKGVLVRHLFPKTCWIMGLYFAVWFKRETSLNPWKRLQLVYRGIRKGKALVPYEENL